MSSGGTESVRVNNNFDCNMEMLVRWLPRLISITIEHHSLHPIGGNWVSIAEESSCGREKDQIPLELQAGDAYLLTVFLSSLGVKTSLVERHAI